MASRPPVTLQEEWETVLRPWLERVAEHLEVSGVELDVDRLHLMTGVAADGVQRSMAPISAFLVGAAVARGASLEEACTAVEAVTREHTPPRLIPCSVRASAPAASTRPGRRYFRLNVPGGAADGAPRSVAGPRPSGIRAHLGGRPRDRSPGRDRGAG